MQPRLSWLRGKAEDYLQSLEGVLVRRRLGISLALAATWTQGCCAALAREIEGPWTCLCIVTDAEVNRWLHGNDSHLTRQGCLRDPRVYQGNITRQIGARGQETKEKMSSPSNTCTYFYTYLLVAIRSGRDWILMGSTSRRDARAPSRARPSARGQVPGRDDA